MSLDLPIFGQRLMAVLSHPDDEVFMAGTLRAAIESGSYVELVYLHATKLRAQEALRATKLLGLSPDQVRFYGAPDGEFHLDLANVIQTLRSEFDRFRPDTVLVPAFELGHLDHDSTNLAVRQAFEGLVLETPLYCPYFRRIRCMGRFADRREALPLPMGASVLNLKSRMLDCYTSQGLKNWWALYRLKEAALHGQPSLGSVEWWAEVPQFRVYSEPLVPKKWLRAVELSPKWQQWRSSTQAQVCPTSNRVNNVQTTA